MTKPACALLVGSKVVTRTDGQKLHPLTVLETFNEPHQESPHTVLAVYDHVDYQRRLGCNAFRPLVEPA